MAEAERSAKVVSSIERTAQPFGCRAAQIHTGVVILGLPEIGTGFQLQLFAQSGNVAVGYAGTMSINVGIVYASAIAIKLQSICQLILGGKCLGIYIMDAIVIEISRCRL